MENPAVILIGGALIILLAAGLLLVLQVWLASRKKGWLGVIQPAAWAVFALVANLLPRLDGAAVEGGLKGIGAIAMAVLSLVTYCLTRRRLK
jgi:hypothetical protein